MPRHWSELIKPEAVEVDEKSLSETYGKFVGEPFERGFGQTIGNSLRRILLSSLRGAAITSVQIENALHEFSTIQGATEDVTDIILNLKEVRLKLHGSEREVIRIDAAGPCEVLAGDIVRGPQVEVLNPEHPIASLSKEGRLNANMVARVGQGYVPAETQPGRGAARRYHLHGRGVLADPQGQLHGDQRPGRPAHRLRPAGAGGVDGRQREARGRAGVRRAHPPGPGRHLRQLRRGTGARGGRVRDRIQRAQRAPFPAPSKTWSSPCGHRTACRTPT